jgi:hypothetical protein
MENADLTVSLFLRKDYQPHFLDLSGEKLFDFYLDIKRCYPSDTDPRDLTLLINESVFDVPYAFQHGVLELIDEETGAVVVWPPSHAPEARKERRFITLPSRSSIPERPGDRLRSIEFGIFEELIELVQPGREYRIWLRDLDLNVKWWSYNPPENLRKLGALPPSEKGKIAAKTTTNKLFRAVSSIRTPPPISVSISLSATAVSYSGLPLTIHAEVTNLGSKTITVKSSGEQPYISTTNVNPRDPRITCPKAFPSLKNFLIMSSTGATVLDIPACPSAGPQGSGRQNFTTLQPGMPLVCEGLFLTQSWLRKKLREDGGEEFTLSLKRQEAWWCERSVNELFGEKETLSWQGMWRSACLPVMLESKDEVVFTLADELLGVDE